MTRPTLLSASPRLESLDQVGGGEVADHGGPAFTAATPSATSRWDFPVPAGPTRQRFSFAVIHSRLAR